jgi:hypothetical protein
MKRAPKTYSWLRPAAVSLAIAGSLALSQAQTYTNVILGQFDCDGCGTIHSFAQWWGEPTWEESWDGSQNAITTLGPNNAGSGAHKFTVHWLSAAVAGTNQNQLMLWQEVDGTQNYWVDPSQRISGFFYDLDFDIKFDPNSAKTVNGDFGHLEFGVSTPSWNQIYLTNFPAFTNNAGWTHVHCYIDPAIVGVDQITAFLVYYPWQPGAITNDQTFWIDNIIMKTNLTKPLKPPTLSLAAVTDKPGLNIAANGSGDNPRESIAAGGNKSWVNHGSTPVTYSLTITNYPGTNHPGLQTHFFLVPNPGGESGPDWNEPNCVFVQLLNNADGTATARFMYKTNNPNNNSMLWGPGTLGYLNCSNGILGTWSLSFTHNTNILMTAPSGQTTTLAFPDETAITSLFPDPLTAYFGQQKNGSANAGVVSTYSRARITGAADADIDDTFPGPSLNTNIWRIACDTPNDLYIISADDMWWLTWTLPDLGFAPVTRARLGTGIWSDLAVNSLVVGANRKAMLTRSMVPDVSQSYFGMLKRVFSRLQVLLPGETAAPDTPTGKTGTPLPQSYNNDAIPIIINACDQNWHIMTSATDELNVDLGFPGAQGNGAATLVAGTTTVSAWYFNVTATTNLVITVNDTTTPTIANGVSSRLTITNP